MSAAWICRFCETQNVAQSHVCEVCGRLDRAEKSHRQVMEKVPRFGNFMRAHKPPIGPLPYVHEIPSKEARKGSRTRTAGILIFFLGVIVLLGYVVYSSNVLGSKSVSVGGVVVLCFAFSVIGLLAWGLSMKSDDSSETMESPKLPDAVPPSYEGRLLPALGPMTQMSLWGNEVFVFKQATQLEIWDSHVTHLIKSMDMTADTPKQFTLQAPYLAELMVDKEQLQINVFELRNGLLRYLAHASYRSTLLAADSVLHPRAKGIVVLKRDSTLLHFNFNGRNEAPLVWKPQEERIKVIAYGTRGELIAAGHEDGTISLLNGKLDFLRKLSGDSHEPISKLLFSPGDEWLVACHISGDISCFRLSLDHPMADFAYHVSDPIRWLSIHPVQHRLMVLVPEGILLLNLYLQRADGLLGNEGLNLIAATGGEDGSVVGVTDEQTLVRFMLPEALLS